MLAALGLVGYLACQSGIAAGAQHGSPLRSETPAVTYTGWRGGCSVNKIADVSCAMRLEARSASGELVGFVVFGHEEKSQFLAVGMNRSITPALLVVKIDSVPISGRPIRCHARANLCSAVMAVDNKLLSRLMNGLVLSAEVRGGIKLSFPLQNFASARRTIL
jgi:invasion protein IalB